MLWNTKIIENAQPLIAKEDIKAIKYLSMGASKIISSSPYQEMPYCLNNRLPKINVECYQYCGAFFIDEGYHSYQYGDVRCKVNGNINAMFLIYNDDSPYGYGVCWQEFLDGNLQFKPYECVIPKGTRYYLNETHEIVSETIIAKEPFMYQWETIENK